MMGYAFLIATSLSVTSPFELISGSQHALSSFCRLPAGLDEKERKKLNQAMGTAAEALGYSLQVTFSLSLESWLSPTRKPEHGVSLEPFFPSCWDRPNKACEDANKFNLISPQRLSEREGDLLVSLLLASPHPQNRSSKNEKGSPRGLLAGEYSFSCV